MSRSLHTIILGLLIAGAVVSTCPPSLIAQEPGNIEERLAALEVKVDRLTRMVEMLLRELDLRQDLSDLDQIEDHAVLGAAKAELASLKVGLTMYQAEDDYSRYPGSVSITSFADLRRILSPYMRVPAAGEMHFTFESYSSEAANTFVLRVRARDSERTLLEVTPTAIRPVRDPG